MTTTSPDILDALKWRYATKKFDSSRRVSEEDITTLKQAVNLTATSYGLQPFRVVLVSDEATKEKLREAAFGQPQLTTASHVFVFASKLEVSPEYVDAFIHRLAEGRGLALEAIQGYGDYIKGSLTTKDADFIKDWTRRQAYIALGSLLATAGELRVDSCPMEGFDPAKVDEILGLTEQGLTASVIAPVGYRSAEDQTQHAAKVRLPLAELFL
ncbi:MAG: NAD(P)H-dependent oxidoreductase [Bacteroidota bacterium]